jgi:hypothetical protein
MLTVFNMSCPHCKSTDLKKLSLIYAAGVHESRGWLGGLFLGIGDGLFWGRYKGRNQSLLSASVAPPKKAPYVAPVVLWLFGFFIVMAFGGRGKLSWIEGALSIFYVLLLPTYLIGSLLYNFAVRPKKVRAWEEKYMCQSCGAMIEQTNNVDEPSHLPLNTNHCL